MDIFNTLHDFPWEVTTHPRRSFNGRYINDDLPMPCTQNSSHKTGQCNMIIINHPKSISNSNLVKTRLFKTYLLIIQLFWYFAQSTSCSVQNFKAIGQRQRISWTNEFSRYLNLRWLWDGYPIFHNTPGCRRYHLQMRMHFSRIS